MMQSKSNVEIKQGYPRDDFVKVDNGRLEIVGVFFFFYVWMAYSMMPLADEGLLQIGTNSHNHILWELAKLRAAAPGASVFFKLAREIFYLYMYA